MIDWSIVSPQTAKQKAYHDVKKIVVPSNYGWDKWQWNMTELILDEDPRKFFAYQILDGVTAEHKHAPGLMPLQEPNGHGPFLFRLRVLTRQACCRDKDGHTFFQSEEAIAEHGVDGDILPDYTDLPKPGDVVEWKGQFREYDEERDKKVTASTLREWAARGIRPETYIEFVVDSDGCISVPYPFVQMMLRKHGKNLAFPKFRKKNRRMKSAQRRLINWWFEEVPRDYKAPRKSNKA